MRHLRTIALLCCGAAAALVAVAASGIDGVKVESAGPSVDRLDATRERLESAARARADGRRSDHFDAIVGSMRAGLGVDTPTELAPMLEAISVARKTEREAATPRARGAAGFARRSAEVDARLLEASRVLGRLEGEATARVPDRVTSPLLWLAATALALVGMLLGVASRAPTARLAPHPLRPARKAATSHPKPDAGGGGEAPQVETPFGRILEIRAVDDASAAAPTKVVRLPTRAATAGRSSDLLRFRVDGETG